MMKKRSVIEAELKLVEMIGKPEETVSCSDEVRDAVGMCQLL